MGNLVAIQDEFLGHVAKLIQKAQKKGLVMSGGELWRTREQQQVYFTIGKSKTMNSMHLKRLALDLNFFVDGDLTYDKTKIQPVGDYWESLHPDNRWGGNWLEFPDTGHFERRA